MKMIRPLFAAALALAALAPLPAFPAASIVNQQQVLCAPEVAGATNGARTVGGTGSQVPSGTLYSLNSQGCGLIAVGDVGYFLSQGFTPGPNLFSIQYAGVTSAASATSVQVGVLPKGALIMGVLLAETAGNAITGGVDIGTTSTGTNYASAVALGANAVVMVADSALTRIIVSSGNTLAEPVFVTCHTSCNNGSITITVLYSFM